MLESYDRELDAITGNLVCGWVGYVKAWIKDSVW
jgi:hypothetical protein